jgi:hypothetical protein
LPAGFPGIHFNADGVCNYCLENKEKSIQENKKLEYQLKFERLIETYKGKSDYDALMCYSGGKDSTYTLALLKEKYRLNILAVSFDNGFIPEQTLVNIRNISENLGIDHIFLKPRFDVIARIFLYSAENSIYSNKALERSSAVCTSCMGIIKYSVLRMAIEKNIPFITFGWSPGQAPIHSSILKNNPAMVRMMQKSLYDQMHQIAGDAVIPYFLEEEHFQMADRFPYNINPLAFLDYDIDKIFKTIESYGWRRPADTDASSTNCLLNSFASAVHKEKLGFHPYAFEIANLVREGWMDRPTAIQRLEQDEDPQTVAEVKNKLEKYGR